MTNNAEAQASWRGRKLKQTVSALAAAAVAASLLVGCSTEQEEPERPKPAVPTEKGSEDPTEEGGGGFSPYVDTSLKPPYDLVEGAEKNGVKDYNLAFVSPGGGCDPKWGGRGELRDNPVAKQVDELRERGGDVRISFGGQSGNELARTCRSVDDLANAYRKVIDAFGLTRVDFDLEGPALTDKKANDRRAQAIVRLQQQRTELDVSFTLPVMPSGLNKDALAVLKNAQKRGVQVYAVNIMAMDYGSYYDGDMGDYAIDAATATKKQVMPVLGIRDDAEAWRTVAVTPMIGVNDVKAEVFHPDDAVQLRKFAKEKGLGWLSMWSATRDKPCPDGPNSKAQASCSSVGKKADEFVRAFTG